ncbi:ABC transporter permease [Hyalangium rubrum]|uniref:ABC transporter permease n=1 Tax=Hyalangium rubrum TaxID=3103134 RepID=A0ABU5GZ63_9BACT|nr:ABC transporter permease [Hyalangium sp. s54d21]MDY7225837.1 ABC transporter permease [Hyalangium sp. s54d21]
MSTFEPARPPGASRAPRWGRAPAVLLGLLGMGMLAGAWELNRWLTGSTLLPDTLEVGRALVALVADGKLANHLVASLYRLSWGYLVAVLVGVPFGMLMGWLPRLQRAMDPLLQVLRPIGSLAWTPLAILWFGVDDVAASFLIAVACFGPLTVSGLNAVRRLPPVYLRAGRNFGLTGSRLVRHILLPAAAPHLVSGMRQALYVGWVVVVMAEMLGVSSGLGFLLVDARNAGDRYDVVMAAIVTISLVGLALDRLMARLARGVAYGKGGDSDTDTGMLPARLGVSRRAA